MTSHTSCCFSKAVEKTDPNMHQKKKILAVVDDLMFTVKIADAAKRVGLDVEFLKSEHDVIDKATHEKPLLIIIDLNNNSVHPLNLIGKLKDDGDLKRISLIGYLSHVQGELKQQAQEAGANIVMARSAFSQNLQQILKRHAGVR
jgi:PleD family two-component response regulator